MTNKTDKIIRMSLRTYRRFRKVIPAKRHETTKNYFERISIILKEMKGGAI